MSDLFQTLKNLSNGRLASIVAIIIFLISFFVYIGVQMSSTDFAILYTDLELEDAKQITDTLDTANIKYRLTKNGTEIMVPVDMVNKMRVDTASLAMNSKGSNVGYEIFDNTDALGSTNFVQNVNLIRALEGELSRTIRSIDNIKSVRVHLVLPKREMFSREEQTPSASVVIKTISGPLSSQNIHSIQKLVAASVPKMKAKNVVVVDSNGTLLSANDDNKQEVKNTDNEILRIEQERKLTTKLQKLLERTVGAGNAQAQVNLEMDFDQVVTNEEIYDPDSKVIRSQATITEEGTSSDNAQSVSVAQNIPNGDMASNPSGEISQNARSEETINYEISKVVRNKIKNNGIVKRLTVAVAINGIYSTDDSNKQIYAARSIEEMDKLSALVKSAVGYDANRGDSVEVENFQFFVEREAPISTELLIMGFTKDELLRIAEGLGVAIVAILVILLVVRPLVNNAFDAPASTNDNLLGENRIEDNLLLSNFLNNEENDDLINIEKIDGRIKASSLKKLNTMIEKNPDGAINIVRSWLYNNDN